jgi:Holliday junction resolvase RusA-like endonuclease
VALRLSVEEYDRLLKKRAAHQRGNPVERAQTHPKEVGEVKTPPPLAGRGMIEFTVPGEPFAWMRAVHYKGKTLTPKAMRANQRTIKALAQLAGCVPILGPVRMTITFFRAIPASWSKQKQAMASMSTVYPTSKPDLSNLLKQVEDALNGTAYKDDSQLVDLEVRKFYARAGEPYTLVRIVPL